MFKNDNFLPLLKNPSGSIIKALDELPLCSSPQKLLILTGPIQESDHRLVPHITESQLNGMYSEIIRNGYTPYIYGTLDDEQESGAPLIPYLDEAALLDVIFSF